MPPRLRIETALARHERATGQSLSSKFAVIKDRLLANEYAYVAASFPGGNDHGSGHILRVLEKLDLLIDGNHAPARLTPYELYLAMVAVLYHDIGILRGREGHADTSVIFLAEEANEYLLNPRDREFISLAVVSHSSSKDIAKTAQHFSSQELVGVDLVRPHVIAALVRLADELDEDYRRADELVQRRADVPLANEFYWLFCQRVLGIRPNPVTRSIEVDVRFYEADVTRTVYLGDERVSLILAAANKFHKINQERITANRFLPEELQYRDVRISVKPLGAAGRWTSPRTFVFDDTADGSDFLQFLQLIETPARNQMTKALASIRSGAIDSASAHLDAISSLRDHLPPDLRARYLYERACVESLLADFGDRRERDRHAAGGLAGLLEWLQFIQGGSPDTSPMDPYNEIFKMSRDSDLYYVLANERDAILAVVSAEYREAFAGSAPQQVPPWQGGCFPPNARISTPDGVVAMGDLVEGDSVVCVVDLESGQPSFAVARVSSIHTTRLAERIVLNGEIRLSHSQPVCMHDHTFRRAPELCLGDILLTDSLVGMKVSRIEVEAGIFDACSLTIDHPAHNYIVDGLVAHNAKEMS